MFWIIAARGYEGMLEKFFDIFFSFNFLSAWIVFTTHQQRERTLQQGGTRRANKGAKCYSAESIHMCDHFTQKKNSTLFGQSGWSFLMRCWVNSSIFLVQSILQLSCNGRSSGIFFLFHVIQAHSSLVVDVSLLKLLFVVGEENLNKS